MIVLTIGSDRSVFRASRARDRIAAYGKVFDRLLIVVFSKRGFSKTELASNVTAYPTNSLTKLGYFIDAYRIGASLIQALSPEERNQLVISAQDPFESGLVAWFLLRRVKAPLQLQVHTDLFSPHFAKGGLVNRMRVFIARCLLRRASCVRAVSARIRSSLIKELGISGERIAVLPIQGGDFLQVKRIEGNPTSHLRILMVSRLEKEKGLDIALKAFGSFLRKGGKGRLTIVGDGSERKKLGRLAKELQIERDVVFAGWREDVAQFYEGADCFLMTSWYEGWGVAAEDALRAGIPVVMTDVGLAGEVARDGENGLIAPVGDITGLAERLLRLEQDQALYAKLAAGARGTPEKSFEAYLKRCRAAFGSCR